MILVKQLVFDYKTMLMQFDFSVPEGQKVAIVGASGAGKSTLLNLIAGFEKATSGEIWLNGQENTDTQPYQRPVSMLFQENNLFPHLNVLQNILLGLRPTLIPTSQELVAVEQVAEKVGLGQYLTRLPTALSGGQKQRVAIARCLLRDQPILLLDEPFSALDLVLRQEMLELLDQLCSDKNLTLLMVTHQLKEVESRINRVISIETGRINANYLVNMNS
ncbi:thiamine ABC transporter ATP-binding protein [Mergibacter septicus]|uniref:Thiamine ABC transporter ATP-binding protein n=1 Tax=Mergibacter septicus TaxID=221402 RepID=A0A8D4LNT2_9PAST|nr:thiamine ABC transporter ATP-binding protein [Mergibacter septicus]AWX16293.1 thiamine ABC transporter ATP-binding protein [Mergibacter septicus]QDJ15543.1 thiamine ABC transporter ATP-binding protein [Mergibacter septicus]UTU48880.1 thiamine ABC transporter ATP-binding protein [Mergibacter septicus]WMR96816.1 thiamine ABC transporter ATP-binding protein [Mergibacter septicus]